MLSSGTDSHNYLIEKSIIFFFYDKRIVIKIHIPKIEMHIVFIEIIIAENITIRIIKCFIIECKVCYIFAMVIIRSLIPV